MVQYQLPNYVFAYHSQIIWVFRSRSPIRPSFQMQGHCGKLITQSFLSSDRAMVQYELPHRLYYYNSLYKAMHTLPPFFSLLIV